jgi:hypothetical protein
LHKIRTNNRQDSTCRHSTGYGGLAVKTRFQPGPFDCDAARNMKTLSFLMVVVVLINSARADSQQQTLAEKLTDEYAACAAYYQIVSADLEKLGKTESAANAYNASESALHYAYLAAQEDKSEETARKVARSRLEFYIKGIVQHMDNETRNISVFAGKPGQRCKDAIEDPDTFRNKLEKERHDGKQ